MQLISSEKHVHFLYAFDEVSRDIYFSISLNFIFIKSVTFIIGSEKVGIGNTFFPSLDSCEMNMYPWSWKIICRQDNFEHTAPEFPFHDGVLICHVFICFCILSLLKKFKMSLMFLCYRCRDFKCACFLCIWQSQLFLF